MPARIIDGKSLAASIRKGVALEVAAHERQIGRVPSLHVLLVGEDPASMIYVRHKERDAVEVGMRGYVHRMPASTTEQQLLGLISELNADPAVNAILVQLPLPESIRAPRVLEAVDPQKDVDGFHPKNVGALWSGLPALAPCTPLGCLRLLREAEVETQGARALVVGRSNIVGKPMAALLLAEHATVTIAHSRTVDLAARCREADILVAAIGRPKMISGEWLKAGAAVIDVGMNRDQEGRLCGDVDFASASEVAACITPVPGGVGPMTRAMLLENTLSAARMQLAAIRAASV